VSTVGRLDSLPDVPPIGDFVKGYEASAWVGVGAPKDTPPEIVARLNEAVNAWLRDPAVKARLADLGGMVTGGSTADAGKLVVEETEKWAKVVKFAGAKAE